MEKRDLRTFIKEACETTKQDINSARESGDKFATDLVAPIKTIAVFDNLLHKSASVMGQMAAGGVTLLMCPMNVIYKELELKK